MTSNEPQDQGVSHNDARVLMTLAWDNEIPAADKGRLLDHLKECGECRKALARMCTLYSLLDEGFAKALKKTDPEHL